VRQRRLPNLAVLRAFEATVRYGSVSKAAKSLNVTDGAVSRAVREFEQTLGFALFQRTSRMVHRRRRRKSWRARSAGGWTTCSRRSTAPVGIIRIARW
jgi:Transcriptional regulator